MNKTMNENRKNFIMLCLSVILVIAVCCAASFAWFNNSTTARGSADIKVIKFDFRTNSKFNEDFTMSPSNTEIYPGKDFTIPFTFSNGSAGNVTGAVYTVEVVSVTAPVNMIWKFGSGSNASSNADVTATVNGKGKLITEKLLESGNSEKFYLYGLWKNVDTETANAQDIAFQQSNNTVTVKLKVTAHQVD